MDTMEARVDQICQAITVNNLHVVQECLDQDKTIINHRHCTKRTPLQIACIASSPEVVQLIVDHGARITARMENGSTALHAAAERGSAEIIRILREKSNRNKKLAIHDGIQASISQFPIRSRDGEAIRDDQGASDSVKLVNVKYGDVNDLSPTGNYLHDQYETGLDILDPNEVSWDTFMSPLHLAIFNGHVDAVRELVSFGADVKRFIKRYEPQYVCTPPERKPTGAVLPLALCFLLERSKAQEMARTLLQLGASPAEADLNRSTPLHFLAAMKDTVPLSVFLENGQEESLLAINYLSNGTPLNGKMYSPLSTAILAGNPDGALDFLEAGAKPLIEFDHFVSSVNSAFPGRKGFCNDKWEFQSIPQPIMAAVENEFPIVVLSLLRSGVDPSTHRHGSVNYGQSILDITRQKINEMREFLAEPRPDEKLQSPTRLLEDSDYLSRLDPDSYRFWAAKITLRRARQHFGQMCNTSNALDKPTFEVKGAKEKRQSVQERLAEFESLEKELLTRKAKLFYELHPENQNSANNKASPTLEEEKPYRPVIFAEDQLDQEAYLSLFDAAWVGDIDTIKALALDWQNEVERKPPLSLGESDCFGFTPLHIAILRGHWEVANEMIEILHAQHKPHKPRESDFYDDEDENGDGDGDRVIEPPETDDDNISDSESEYDWEEDKEENVQERPKRPAVEYVKLRASPLTVTLLSECPAYLFTERSEVADEFRPWSTQDGSRIFITYSSGQEPKRGLIDHAILMNDIELLRFLLEMTKSLTNRDHRRRTMDSVLREPFLFALKLGRIDCLSMMIEKGGASLFEQKPIYYYQKSPSDKQPTSYTKSPLLAAAMEGNLETTLWMMGPDAIRHYVKYIKSHEDDQRLEKFTNSEDGIEKSVLKWLHHKDELVLHCVIKSKPCEESERLIQYLINRYPEYMEVRSEEGYTPLSLAFILQRPSFAQILINLGADQTVKDNLGNNLLHLLLACPQITPIGSQSCLNADLLREMLGMLNPNGVHVMLLERNKSRCQTPLMRWISSQRDSYGLDTFQNMMNRNRSDRDDQLPVVKLLLSYGGKTQTEQLELIDDNGNSPAHIAVTSKLPALLQLFLEHRPDLLQRENSSGKTPADLASAEWTKFAIDEDRTGRRSPLVINTQFNSASNNVVQRDPLSFVDFEAPIKADKGRPHHRKIHELCHSHASNGNYQRRLFTAGDAAAIARMKVANAPSQFFTRHWLFFEDQSPPLLPIR